MRNKFLIYFSVLGFSLSGVAQNASGPAATTPAAEAVSDAKEITYLICKNKSAVRTLRVQKKSSGACFTTYTKNGEDQVVGNSWEFSKCTKVLSNIRENLEKAEWKCKDISEARVSAAE